MTEPDGGTFALDKLRSADESNDIRLDADPTWRCVEIANSALKNRPEANFTVTLLDDLQCEELPEVKPTLPTIDESNVEECFPNTEIKLAPDTAALVIEADDNERKANDEACENFTLGDSPRVTMREDKIPSPLDARHRMEDSDNQSENIDAENPTRTRALRDVCPKWRPETMAWNEPVKGMAFSAGIERMGTS
jgi:hypothetical protein